MAHLQPCVPKAEFHPNVLRAICREIVGDSCVETLVRFAYISGAHSQATVDVLDTITHMTVAYYGVSICLAGRLQANYSSRVPEFAKFVIDLTLTRSKSVDFIYNTNSTPANMKLLLKNKRLKSFGWQCRELENAPVDTMSEVIQNAPLLESVKLTGGIFPFIRFDRVIKSLYLRVDKVTDMECLRINVNHKFEKICFSLESEYISWTFVCETLAKAMQNPRFVESAKHVKELEIINAEYDHKEPCLKKQVEFFGACFPNLKKLKLSVQEDPHESPMDRWTVDSLPGFYADIISALTESKVSFGIHVQIEATEELEYEEDSDAILEWKDRLKDLHLQTSDGGLKWNKKSGTTNPERILEFEFCLNKYILEDHEVHFQHALQDAAISSDSGDSSIADFDDLSD